MKGTVAASGWPAVSLSLWLRHSDTLQSTAWVADPYPWLQQWALTQARPIHIFHLRPPSLPVLVATGIGLRMLGHVIQARPRRCNSGMTVGLIGK